MALLMVKPAACAAGVSEPPKVMGASTIGPRRTVGSWW